MRRDRWLKLRRRFPIIRISEREAQCIWMTNVITGEQKTLAEIRRSDDG